MKDLHLTSKEWDKLSELHKKARTTPVMLIGGIDISEAAWDAVRRYMEELGRKYKVDPRQTRFRPPKKEGA